MTHELLKIINNYRNANAKGVRTVLATVVALVGSSYRRPGVRMLITEEGSLTGAVSGGCVEKEILRQSQQVFESGGSKMMIYDGRYRLGCEGVLYILLEPFQPTQDLILSLQNCIDDRQEFNLQSLYFIDENEKGRGYTQFVFGDDNILLSSSATANFQDIPFKTFEQNFKPPFRLMIIGSEHDAVQLCAMASLMGWEVWVVASGKDPRKPGNFPGVSKLLNEDADMLQVSSIDRQTAVILMTHSFVNDLKYLYALRNTTPCYLGLLGPSARREKLLHSFIEQYPDDETHIFDSIKGPAGLHLGAETPQEIAVSIISEILSFTRGVQPMPLKDKKGSIHSDI